MLRARTGLTLSALAGRTPYSRSSWERYLNGRVLAPDDAVVRLCRLAGERPERALALWELAEVAWSGRARIGSGSLGQQVRTRQQETAPGRPRTGRAGLRRSVLIAAGVAAGVAGLGAALLLRAELSGQDPPPNGGTGSTRSLVTHCQGGSCTGRNPVVMDCGTQPRTVAARHLATGADLEIRYSSECAAGWVRLGASRVGDRAQVTVVDGPARTSRAESVRTRDRFDAEGYTASPMLPARPGTTLRACYRPAGAAASANLCITGRVAG